MVSTESRGFSRLDASSAAHGYLHQQLQHQVSLLAFMNFFRIIGWLMLAVVIPIQLVRRFKVAGKEPTAH
jgi:hypothetical protein